MCVVRCAIALTSQSDRPPPRPCFARRCALRARPSGPRLALRLAASAAHHGVGPGRCRAWDPTRSTTPARPCRRPPSSGAPLEPPPRHRRSRPFPAAPTDDSPREQIGPVGSPAGFARSAPLEKTLASDRMLACPRPLFSTVAIRIRSSCPRADYRGHSFPSLCCPLHHSLSPHAASQSSRSAARSLESLFHSFEFASHFLARRALLRCLRAMDLILLGTGTSSQVESAVLSTIR